MKPLALLLLAVALGAAEPLVDTNAADLASAPVVAEDETFRARITVRNPNDVAVKVASTDATCTCATLELVDRFILPHATTELVLEVDNRNRSEGQRLGVSLYLGDPDLDAIEVVALWTVRAHVQVDSLPVGADPLARPAKGFQDVYRFPGKVRPDELRTLRKRIRLSCPADETPEGGLRVTGVEYAGGIYAFTPTVQADGSVLLEARGKEGGPAVADGVHDEEAVVLTNHPKKARIPLVFVTYVGKDAGAVGFDPDAKRGDEFKALQNEDPDRAP